MSEARKLLIGLLGLLLCPLALGVAQAAEDSIPPGTKITMQNWQQYKAFMPDGMIALFSGQYAWKMPDDVEMDVGPTTIHPLPKPFWDAVEKYSAQTRLVKLPNGAYNIENYVSGVPFPHPEGPDKGTQIADDVTFRPGGVLYTGFPDLPGNAESSFCTVDRFGSKACSRVDYDYRQLAYNWFPGVPHTGSSRRGSMVWRMANGRRARGVQVPGRPDPLLAGRDAES